VQMDSLVEACTQHIAANLGAMAFAWADLVALPGTLFGRLAQVQTSARARACVCVCVRVVCVCVCVCA